MEHKYCGKTLDEMNEVLDKICALEDELDLDEEMEYIFDIVIQCVTTIINRMKIDRPIEWDDE